MGSDRNEDLWGDSPVRLNGWKVSPIQSGAAPGLSLQSFDAGHQADGAEVPTALNQLNRAQNRSYDLSVTAAGDIGIPVAGTFSSGGSQRVVVLERAAFRQIDFPNNMGSEQWGYAIRFCVTVSRFDASLKFTLPFLAASAQVGRIEAQWMLQVVGLAGPKIDAESLPPTDLNVETFVLAKQSLEGLINAVRDDSTQFSAARLATITPEQVRLAKYQKAIGTTVALDGISDNTDMAKLLARVSNARVADAIRDTYQEVTGGAQITQLHRRMASDLLGRVRIR